MAVLTFLNELSVFSFFISKENFDKMCPMRQFQSPQSLPSWLPWPLIEKLFGLLYLSPPVLRSARWVLQFTNLLRVKCLFRVPPPMRGLMLSRSCCFWWFPSTYFSLGILSYGWSPCFYVTVTHGLNFLGVSLFIKVTEFGCIRKLWFRYNSSLSPKSCVSNTWFCYSDIIMWLMIPPKRWDVGMVIIGFSPFLSYFLSKLGLDFCWS